MPKCLGSVGRCGEQCHAPKRLGTERFLCVIGRFCKNTRGLQKHLESSESTVKENEFIENKKDRRDQRAFETLRKSRESRKSAQYNK